MPDDAQSAQPLVGWESDQVISDRYRVNELVHRSASCHLYLVTDVFRSQTHLALRPSPETLAEEGGREWFARFARAALAVPFHPNLLPCRRLDKSDDIPYLVMDDVGGERWSSAIRKGHLLDLRSMLSVAIQAGQALAWLHANGHVHANMKPANAIITDAGVLKVLKYGESDALTRAYASPEQLAGADALTPATDMWSWAACVLHTFVGVVTWTHEMSAPEALDNYLEYGPATPETSLMPVGVVDLLRRCFEEDPDARPSDMEEVVAVVEDVYQDATNSPFELPEEAFEPLATSPENDDFELEQPAHQEPDCEPEPEEPAHDEAPKPPERRRYTPNRPEHRRGDRRRPR